MLEKWPIKSQFGIKRKSYGHTVQPCTYVNDELYVWLQHCFLGEGVGAGTSHWSRKNGTAYGTASKAFWGALLYLGVSQLCLFVI